MRPCLLPTDIPSISAKTNTSLSAIRTVLLTCVFVGFLVAPVALQAQTAHFAGVQSTIGSGLNSPSGGRGGWERQRLYRRYRQQPGVEGDAVGRAVHPEHGPIGSGLNRPDGVAVDGSGNVYIADTDNNRVLKETPWSEGSYTQSTVAAV